MAYHPRIEAPELANLVTTRTRNRELWFSNNEGLEQSILATAAKCSKRYEADLYALAIEGTHIHAVAHFSSCNRSAFMRDLNSAVAKAVAQHVPSYPGGQLWGRRYSNEFLPGAADIEEKFFYTVLQPVQDGLVERISDYPGYNCFHDAIWGIERKFEVVRWSDYYEAKRWHPEARVKDFTDTVTLKYKRLPGYEDMDRRSYAMMMMQKLEARRLAIIEERRAKGKVGFLGRRRLLATLPGTQLPDSPENEEETNNARGRVRVLSVCPLRRAEYLRWYFDKLKAYREASQRYRAGDFSVNFPSGMYRPHLSP